MSIHHSPDTLPTASELFISERTNPLFRFALPSEAFKIVGVGKNLGAGTSKTAEKKAGMPSSMPAVSDAVKIVQSVTG